MKLRIKWSSLTDSQQQSVRSFYQEAIQERKIILNQRHYYVNASNGEVIFFKDY